MKPTDKLKRPREPCNSVDSFAQRVFLVQNPEDLYTDSAGVLWAGRRGDLLRGANSLVQGQARSLQGRDGHVVTFRDVR